MAKANNDVMQPTEHGAQPSESRMITLLKRVFATPKELGFLPHAWLVFLSFFVVQMIPMKPMSLPFGLCVVALLVFIPTYYAAFRREGRAMYRPIAIISLLGMLLTPINLGSNVFFNFAAHMCGQAMSARRAMVAVGLMCAWMLLASYALSLPWWYWGPGIIVAVGLLGISINDRRRQLADSALRRSREEVHRLAQIAERERIARDLHDVLGHTLSVITLKAELAGKLIDKDPAKAQTELAQIAQTSRAALANVRETVSGYRRVGLADQIDDAGASLRSAGIEFESAIASTTLRPREETVLALIVREAVTNVIRHANASTCRIDVARDEQGLVMNVIDNGQGFDSDEGQGLTGMRERLTVLNGTLTVRSNEGTHLQVKLPGAGRPNA
ncbi:MAG: sensor histidine kinase [Gammaproteobacteria bacterium]